MFKVDTISKSFCSFLDLYTTAIIQRDAVTKEATVVQVEQ